MAREHDDRRFADRGVFQLLGAKVPPVHHRHHEIKDDGVGAQARFHQLETALSVLGGDDAVALVFQEIGQRARNIRVVIYNQKCRR